MSECIFCKVIAGAFGTEFLYEDEHCVIFRDINPKAKTHLLIVPRKHIPSVAHVEEEDKSNMGNLIWSAKKIAEKLKLPAYRLQIHVGKEAGQEIFHLHVHLMSNF